jgi:poly(3-hydroxybutyrate) depolymerase
MEDWKTGSRANAMSRKVSPFPAWRVSGMPEPRPSVAFRLPASGLSLLLLLAPLAAGGGGDEWRQWENARARVHAARMAVLERDRLGDFDFSYRLASEQAALRASVQALASGRQPAVRPGVRLEAYLSVNDDSAQPFLRYLPAGYSPTGSPPLVVFLHGYNPGMDIIDDPYIPAVLGRIADETGACLVAPFGRGNTDYQGIGEQDVIRVIDEMQARYRTDPRRVVLAGYSMGGLGVWCIGARHPDRFNGLLPISGRGDFYTWHSLKPADLPPWQRRLVDTQFAAARAPDMTNLAVLAWHGMQDDLVTFREGRAIFARIQPRNPHARFFAFPRDGHGIVDGALLHDRTTDWLRDVLTHEKPKDRPTGLRVGETGSRLQDAFLRPFLFVGGTATNQEAAAATLAARAGEWQRFTRTPPRSMLESGIDTNLASACHLFIFGEPEASPLVCRVLQDAGVEVTPATFRIAGRTLPRGGHGLWFTGRNPLNPQRLGIVQCGIPWGENLSDNHRYDRIPDVIAYASGPDRWGCNLAVAAGFLDDQGHVQWADPPVTPAILPQPKPAAISPAEISTLVVGTLNSDS